MDRQTLHVICRVFALYLGRSVVFVEPDDEAGDGQHSMSSDRSIRSTELTTRAQQRGRQGFVDKRKARLSMTESGSLHDPMLALGRPKNLA